MKGTIVKGLEEMVVSKYGFDKWKKVLEIAEFPTTRAFTVFENLPDSSVTKLINACGQVLDLPLESVADAFGEHWMTIYAPKTYKYFVTRSKNARDFILSIDEIHATVTKLKPNTKPPHFEYRWIDEQTLHMVYLSDRNLLFLAAGLVRGVGKYFNTPMTITEIPPDILKIVFL